MTEQLLSPVEFAQSIKAKYPDYASVPDDELAAKMLEKYPEYRDRVQAADFKQTDTTPNEVDPNTLGTFARHVGAQINPIPLGQMVPFPKAAGGAGWDAPIQAVKAIGAAQGVPLDNAIASYTKGDYGGAAIHLLNYFLPVIGPILDKSGNEMRAGKHMAGLGDALGLAGALVGPKALEGASANLKVPAMAANPNPVEAAAVKFGQARGIPVDAATATGSRFVKGAQFLADRSLGGSMVSETAKANQAQALARVGGELANEARGTSITPELAGKGIVDALSSKVTAHEQFADRAYDTLRAMEEQPTNRMKMPGKPVAVDGIPDVMRGQLRRIVHEMDASGFTPGKLLADDPTGGSGTTYIPRTGGAKVFDDIKGFMSEGANPTRGVVQNQIETYLGGGPETSIVKAALEVAAERAKARGGATVSLPEMPASAMDVATRLEGQATDVEMGFPVDLKSVKTALRPVYDQMKRQMPITQQQANPGLKAIENIIQGDDYAPLSQADRDLSTIKGLARKQGGLAKMAVAKFEAAVQQAAANGGPDVVRSLGQGRGATTAKYGTADLLEQLRAEPVQAFRQAIAPKDSGIDLLRAVVKDAPQTVPQISRAYLEELLGQATAEGGFDKTGRLKAQWDQLGTETKKILFPQKGQTQALDHFFLLAKKIGEVPNTSGTASVAAIGQMMGGMAVPATIIPTIVSQVGLAGISKLLHSPAGVRALTRGLSVELKGSAVSGAARGAALAEIAAAARSAGIPLAAPVAGPSPQSRPQ